MTTEPTESPNIAASMADLAEAFREDAVADGYVFGYTAADAARLDEYVDRTLAQQPSDDDKHGLILTGGAYVGELLVRLAGARWSEEDQSSPSLVLTNGLVGKPLDKVAKRVHIGSMHSLGQYVEFVLTGADASTFPGAQVHQLRPHDEA